jgi:hypothetical protein
MQPDRAAHPPTTVPVEAPPERDVASAIDEWLPPEPAVAPLPAVDDVQDAPPPADRPSGGSGWLVAGDMGSLVDIAGVMFLNLANTGGVFRLVLALLFITWVPGWALVRASGLSGGLTGVAIAILASLTISAATSTAMVWLNAWHPLMLVVVMATVSAVVILWTLPPAFVAARAGR